MSYNTYTLKNGIRLIHKPDASNVIYCGIAINAGTRDENPDEQGMAHFVEHMLFKGTPKRNVKQIINRLEDIGGEINACTTKEETFIYSIILAEYMERSVELMADIVFNSAFPSKEIEKEIDVVLDEILSYNDNPSELIFDDFEELLFPNDAIGRNILGTEKSVQQFDKAKIADFIERNYHSEEMVFFSLGNVDFKRIVRWAEKYLGKYPASSRTNSRIYPQAYKAQQKQIRKETFQIHSVCGNRAYHLHHADRLAFHFLNNILGGPGMSSLLNMSLRENNGLAYNVESNYTPYSDTGVFAIYFGCDEKNRKRCEHLIRKELEKLQQKTISPAKLTNYKRQIIGQLAIANENRESFALGMGKSFLHTDELETLPQIQKKLEAVSATKLTEIANEILDFQTLTTLVYD